MNLTNYCLNFSKMSTKKTVANTSPAPSLPSSVASSATFPKRSYHITFLKTKNLPAPVKFWQQDVKVSFKEVLETSQMPQENWRTRKKTNCLKPASLETTTHSYSKEPCGGFYPCTLGLERGTSHESCAGETLFCKPILKPVVRCWYGGRREERRLAKEAPRPGIKDLFVQRSTPPVEQGVQ